MNNNIARANKNELQLSVSYLELIQHLWNKSEPKGIYSPNNFMNTLESLNPLFKKGDAGDAKDFIIFILERLHLELKKPCSNYSPQYDNIPMNQYDKENSFNHFMDGFKKELSIISDLFFGLQETRNECLNCKNNYTRQGMNYPICYNYQIFNLLIFPLEEVKNMKNKNNSNMNNNIVNLDDCFIYSQKPERFTGDNQNYCNICQHLNDSNYTSLIYSFPTILIIILNRGKNNQDFNEPFRFDETLDFSNMIKHQNSCKKYFLCGIITHLGKSGSDGHFIAYCRNNFNDNFTCYNDAGVSKVGVTTAMEAKISKHEIEKKTPYILLYHYMK
jgi:ubiquitin C-terminal hydrolase